MFTFDLQLHGKGSSTTTNTTVNEYTPTVYELMLQKAQANYSNAVAPNALYLNSTARKILEDSIGAVQVNFNKMNTSAQNQINAANAGYSNLAQGKLPTAYTQNMTDAIKSGVQNSFGQAVNSAANSGILNSSVTSQALNDISRNVSDTMANNYSNNISALGNIYSNQINSATAGITAGAAAQEAAQTPAINLWNASMGLNGQTTGALAAAAGKGTNTMTSTQTTSGGSGGFWSGLLGAGASLGSAMIMCFPAGTKINMADGSTKDICYVNPGDMVETTEGAGEVRRKLIGHEKVLVLKFHNGWTIRTTETQTLMDDKGEWQNAGDMPLGTEIKGVGKLASRSLGEEETVYDLEISGVNNYYADGAIAQGGSREIWRG